MLDTNMSLLVFIACSVHIFKHIVFRDIISKIFGCYL